ncbi:D-2-hydroxyacid dehydrogenase [Marispirochaeta sp.]|jgi:phosphoglycerate dehydrogenase-like enzyme|uniref:D-2-hydroxyacid dehydrogenase n=1 Tax=Marispirochaeta sp. TaxID=2038653 RepID=UPI0029C8FDC3|nr:D-2-hydroxyacid dehydrogenase [Marispirochaeta sp.]
MKYIIYGTDPEKADDELIKQIQTLAPEYKVVCGKTEEELAPWLANAELAFREIDIDVLLKMPSLKWYQAWTAGVDHLLEDPRIMESSFKISTASGIHPVALTEHIFALLLTLSRGLQYSQGFRRQHSWKKVPALRIFELEGKTMLILGAGAIGRRSATIARAFGMRVIAAKRRHLDRLGPFDEVVPWEGFREYLKTADVVLNILPLTHETEGFFGAAEFKLMRSESVFINVGRGKTVHTDALLDALENGTIAGACLDVIDPEPLGKESPAWEMENLILTGHYAGITPKYEERGNALFLSNLELYIKGQEPENLVDRERGY